MSLGSFQVWETLFFWFNGKWKKAKVLRKVVLIILKGFTLYQELNPCNIYLSMVFQY